MCGVGSAGGSSITEIPEATNRGWGTGIGETGGFSRANFGGVIERSGKSPDHDGVTPGGVLATGSTVRNKCNNVTAAGGIGMYRVDGSGKIAIAKIPEVAQCRRTGGSIGKCDILGRAAFRCLCMRETGSDTIGHRDIIRAAQHLRTTLVIRHS